MTITSTVVPLLVFEAADCLMAIPASEIAHLEKSLREPFSAPSVEKGSRSDFSPHFDLGTYFNGRDSDGPWLHWGRGTRGAWLRVHSVVDVVPIEVSGLSPMPSLLRADRRTRAFLAAGVRGDDVFLLLDPARLSADSFALKAGLPDSSRLSDSSDSSRLPDSPRRVSS
jgi:hypothetical protein